MILILQTCHNLNLEIVIGYVKKYRNNYDIVYKFCILQDNLSYFIKNIQMDKQSFSEIIYLKRKESFVVGVLLMIAIIIFVVPITAIFLLWILFKQFSYTRKKATVSVKADLDYSFESRFN